MTEAEKRSRILQARQLVKAHIQTLAAGPIPSLRRCAYSWEETGPGIVTLILYVGARLQSLSFTEDELLEGAGSEGHRECILGKLEGFLLRTFGPGEM